MVVTHGRNYAFRIADRMMMLDRGRVVRRGPRAEFERLRDTPPERLPFDADRRIHQFLRGRCNGPLTDVEGLSEFEEVPRTGGPRSTTL